MERVCRRFRAVALSPQFPAVAVVHLCALKALHGDADKALAIVNRGLAALAQRHVTELQVSGCSGGDFPPPVPARVALALFPHVHRWGRLPRCEIHAHHTH